MYQDTGYNTRVTADVVQRIRDTGLFVPSSSNQNRAIETNVRQYIENENGDEPVWRPPLWGMRDVGSQTDRDKLLRGLLTFANKNRESNVSILYVSPSSDRQVFGSFSWRNLVIIFGR